MSSDESLDNDSSSTSSPDKRRSTVPDILPQQRSFEKRYSHIIHRQILETGINKEALQRQINAFFSYGGEKKTHNSEETQPESTTEETDEAVEREEELARQDEAECENAAREGGGKSLEKLDTLDVADAN